VKASCGGTSDSTAKACIEALLAAGLAKRDGNVYRKVTTM